MKTIMKKNHEDLDREDNDKEADGEEGEAGDGQGHLRQQSSIFHIQEEKSEG